MCLRVLSREAWSELGQNHTFILATNGSSLARSVLSSHGVFHPSRCLMVLAQPLSGADLETDRIRRARLGESEALHELMTSHRAFVEQVAKRFVTDHDDLEDITQETWIRASNALGSLRDEARFRPWLRAITRNACLTFLARRHPSDSLDDDDADELADRASEGPEAATEQRDDRRRVWEALGALPELDRRALFFRDVESLPFEEVARRLGVRKNAAEVRVHRARSKFRQLYEATDTVEPPCGMAGIRLALLLDNELHGEPATAVEHHLEACLGCRQRIKTMAQGRSLYRRMGMFGLPGLTGLVDRLQRAADTLMRTVPAEAMPMLASQGGASGVAVTGIAAAALAAVAIAVPTMASALPIPTPTQNTIPPATAGTRSNLAEGPHTPVLIMGPAWTPPGSISTVTPGDATAPQSMPAEHPRVAERPVAAATDFKTLVAGDSGHPTLPPVNATPEPSVPSIVANDASGTAPATPPSTTTEDDKGGSKGKSSAAKHDDKGGPKGNSSAAKDDDKGGPKGNSPAPKDDDKGGPQGNSPAAKDDDKGGPKGNSSAAKDDDKGGPKGSSGGKH